MNMAKQGFPPMRGRDCAEEGSPLLSKAAKTEQESAFSQPNPTITYHIYIDQLFRHSIIQPGRRVSCPRVISNKSAVSQELSEDRLRRWESAAHFRIIMRFDVVVSVGAKTANAEKSHGRSSRRRKSQEAQPSKRHFVFAACIEVAI